mgnify:CR=1 FL=1
MTISAVVLQHNLPELTAVAVASIRESDTRIDELIIVDNGSTPGNWLETVKIVDANTRILRLDKNYGYVIGINRGWEAATGDYILLCANSIAVSKSCIGRLASVLDQDKQVGWVCGYYQTERAGLPDFAVSFPADVLAECNDSHGAMRDRLNAWAATMPEPVEPFASHVNTEATVVMVRKAMSDKIGYFWDELVYFHSHDYGKRMSAAGWKMSSARSAVFWHDASHPTIRHANGGSIVCAGYDTSEKLYHERYK